MAAAARERGPELDVITCSLIVKQAFDNVLPENLSLVMKALNIALVLAETFLMDQIGGKYDICFQERDKNFWCTLRQVQNGKERRVRACSN